MQSKKLVTLGLAGLMVLSLLSCNSTAPTSESTVPESEVVQSEPVSEEEPEEPQIVLVDGTKVVDDHFDANTPEWGAYAFDGVFESAVENEELVVKITKSGTQTHAVQVYRDGFPIYKGGVYDVEFDIRSDIERDFEWRIQMNGGHYQAYVLQESTHLTTEMQHIKTSFTMEEESDPAPRFCFNLGVQGDLDNTLAHNVYIDNVVVTITDTSNAIIPAPLPKPNKVNLSQIGYQPDDTKLFVSAFKGDTTFDIIDTTTKESVYTGSMSSESISSVAAGQDVHQGDFSDFNTPGTYYIHLANAGDSYEFTIADDVYDDIYAATVKMLYLQRCGMELTSDKADSFSHPACHTQEATIYGSDKKIDVSGGWHDAGDYGRYVVPGAKTVADLFLTYQDSNNTADDFGIPESGNKIPDILDEARYELDWMLKMQAADGGVYHKVTCTIFPETVMPQDETAELIVCPVSTTATGDFAAVMAKASVIYKDFDPDFASTCLAASKKAYEYMVANADHDTRGFHNPDEIVTGEYPDLNNKDEYFWASAELYNATGDAYYLSMAKTQFSAQTPMGLGWNSVGIYGIYALLSSDTTTQVESTMKDEITDAEFMESLKDKLLSIADKNKEKAEGDGYNIPLTDSFPWGSNMVVANDGMIFYMAYNVTKDESYRTLADFQTDYLLGMNPLGYCYVTGYGTLTPKEPHHRPSEFIGEAVPGMLVGGPDNALEDPYAKAVLFEKAPGLSYVDKASSFSTNEVTIYWNSPLIYLLSNK